MIAKPGLGVFFVRPGLKAGIRTEVARGPFPDVSDHLPATPGAVTCRQRIDINAAHVPPIKIRLLGRRKLITPWVASLEVIETISVGPRLARGGGFPFWFSRKAAPRPPAEGFRLEPVYVEHGMSRLERAPGIKVAPQPASGLAAPVNRMFGAARFAPAPACGAPQVWSPVASVFYKPRELLVADCGLRNRERFDLDVVSPFLIIETEEFVS